AHDGKQQKAADHPRPVSFKVQTILLTYLYQIHLRRVDAQSDKAMRQSLPKYAQGDAIIGSCQ
ncbi:hypothetical protein ACT02P_26770, partial [Enterobacter hormaechei]|uniref:hypothetical protein n=1 Tax=Enterobacter hormaechei TaxID=158836 RepID=UPI00402AF432